MKTKKPIFLKSLFGISLAFILALVLFYRAAKSKSSFYKAKGTIVSFDKKIESRPNDNNAKFRYLQINSYPKTFELFIGSDWGDFKPKFERIDDLKIGDTVTVYFDENIKTEADPINRLVYFIDLGDKPIFIKGGWEKYLAYFIWGLTAVILFVLVVAKQKSKIS